MPERYTKQELEGLSIDAKILADEIALLGHSPEYSLTPRYVRIFSKHLKGERGRGVKADFMLGNTLIRVKRRERSRS